VSLKQRATYDLLEARSGAGFDETFMKHNVSDHEQDIKDFTEEANGTSDADVKSFALRTLKTLQEHLELSRKVNSDIATADK
jgi:putative membrane protein